MGQESPYVTSRNIQHLIVTHYNTLHLIATHCNTLQHTATHCNTLQHTATGAQQHGAGVAICHVKQHTTPHYNTLQHTATHYNTLQHTATGAQQTVWGRSNHMSSYATHNATLQHTATHCNRCATAWGRSRHMSRSTPTPRMTPMLLFWSWCFLRQRLIRRCVCIYTCIHISTHTHTC